MNAKKVGKIITALRKKAGYTQKELASKLYISDKAVSKWERGVCYPDVSYLRKLSVLLDTDIETLLIGKMSFEDRKWIGVIDLKDRNDEIDLCSYVYDKPLVYIFLSYFLLVGINDALIICDEKEESFIREKLKKDNMCFLNIAFARKGEKYDLDDRNVMCIFEKYFIYGMGLSSVFQRALANNGDPTILAMPRTPDESRRQIRFNEDMMLSVNDDYVDTQYNYCYLPFLFTKATFFDKDYQKFIEEKKSDVYVELLNRGYAELFIENRDDLKDASDMLALLEKRSGFDIYDPKEIALQRLLLQEGE